MNVLSVLTQLANESSTNSKLAILTANKDYKALKDTFIAAYSNINYYIKKLPDTPNAGVESLEWGFEQIQKLANREFTGNAGINYLTYTLSQLSPDDAEVICRIIKKDLRAGISKTGANKIWPGIIDKLPIMLAKPMKEEFIKNIRYPAFAQLKSDGARCICIVDELGVTLLSRNNKEYHCLNSLKENIVKFLGGRTKVVLDGELLLSDANGDLLNRQTGNGIINKSSKNTITKFEADRVFYNVWDIVPIEDYFNGKYDKPYAYRFAELNQCSSNEQVIIIENTPVMNLDEAKVVFNKYVQQGLEGIILKNTSGFWEDTRSKDQVKFKVEIMVDMICTGIYEGDGKYRGMLGGLICQSKDGLVNVNVGSGFNDKQRKAYWNDKQAVINKVVEVKCNAVITSTNSKYSLFLPIFQYIREDKNLEDADTLESIDG